MANYDIAVEKTDDTEDMMDAGRKVPRPDGLMKDEVIYPSMCLYNIIPKDFKIGDVVKLSGMAEVKNINEKNIEIEFKKYSVQKKDKPSLAKTLQKMSKEE